MENFTVIKHIECVKRFIAFRATLNDPKMIEKMDALIDLHKKMVPDKMQHPVDDMYHGGKDGGLFSDYTKKWSRKKPHENGYITDKISTNGKMTTMQRHRLIYECYYQEKIGKDLQIDHIDSDPSNNSIFNLQKLTVKEHNQKTHGGKKSKGALKQSKSVTRFNINNGKEIDEIVYKSIDDASIAIGCKPSDIANVLGGRQKTTKGYFFKYTEIKGDDKYENEEWKKLADIDNLFKEFKSEISDFGRVKSELGIISFGSIKPSGYCVVNIKKINYFVHVLVALAFHGKRPSNQDTVDHKNRQKDDNRKENLKWASKSEQADNCCTTPINVYKNDKLVGYYKSLTLAAKKLNLKKASISWSIKNKAKTRQGYRFELVKKVQDV